MRSIWKGAISFGLVTIPVKVLGATENHSVSFRQIHRSDGGRIRYRKVCELEDEEVSTEEISKGYETADGKVVELSDDDLSALPLPTAKTVEILGFVPVDSIDPIQLDRSYYLSPDSGGEKPYVLLREALKRSNRGAIAKLAMRGRETLGLLRVLDDVIVLHTMLWPDEIRSARGVAPEGRVNVRDAELDLADTLMNTLGDVHMEALHDDYRGALEELVSAKLAGTEPAAPGREPAPGRVVDLMAALESSVRAAREGREGEADETAEATVSRLRTAGENAAEGGGKEIAEEAEASEEAERAEKGGKAPAKKTSARKPAKKTAEKKAAPAKKSAEKKTTGRKRAS